MPVFAGSDLTCLRGDRIVFSALDFEVPSGAALILTGRNGSGKTSLLRIMAGLLRPWRGEVFYNGMDIAEDPDIHRTRVIYAGHQDAVKPALTAVEHLMFWAKLLGQNDAYERATRGLERFGLLPLTDVPARYMSSGQRRRLNLARFLVGSAPVWLLDEPITGLDALAVAYLEDALAEHQARGGIIVLSTHGSWSIANAFGLDMDAYAGPAPGDTEDVTADYNDIEDAETVAPIEPIVADDDPDRLEYAPDDDDRYRPQGR